MKKIYSELSRIQQELKAPKNLYNSFGKYKYRNAEGILESVKPLLNGLALIINDEPIQIGDRYYIKATVTITDGEEYVSAVAYAREDTDKKGMDGCQITGACSSYARKYALNALLMIDDSKDSDDDSLSPKNPENQEKFENPPMPKNGQVQKAKTLPVNPTMSFLNTAFAQLREARGLTDQQNIELIQKQKDALVGAGLAPDKPVRDYTLEEAEAFIDALYKNFTPTGTEVKAG